MRVKYNKQAIQSIKSIRHSSFFYKGPQLYNLLPPVLRQLDEIEIPEQKHVDEFKEYLDEFLTLIPDQPSVPELTKCRSAATNSLICQVPVLRKDSPHVIEQYQQNTQQKIRERRAKQQQRQQQQQQQQQQQLQEQ